MSFLSRLANALRPDRLTRELDEELQSHIAEAIGQGRDPAEARRAFGPALHHREDSRDHRIFSWLDSLHADAIFAWRQINKHKTTSAAAILSLGLAIGACTAAFRLMDALFLRPLPISDPQNLYALSRAGSGDAWQHKDFRGMRAAIANRAGLIAVSLPEQTPTSDREIREAQVQYVSGWMFDSFGLRPALGRLLTAADDLHPGAHPVAVLSYDYWTRRFGRDPKVVGSTMTVAPRYGMGSILFEIAGVAREGFTGTEVGAETEVFLPATMHPLVDFHASLFRIFVRLPPSTKPEPVRARLDAFLRTSTRPTAQPQALLMERAAAGVSGMQKNYAQPLAALGVLVALVLLIACANVANLLSAQAAARARGMALRVAIGAGRARLVQLVLVESAMLALGAAAFGAIVAWQSAPFVVARINPSDNPARLSLDANGRVLAAGLVLTLAVTILLSLTPALRASAVRPASALRGGQNPRSRTRLMHALIAVQAAFCFLVLFVSGLFAATFDRLQHQPVGFSVDGLLALDTVTPRDEPHSAWLQLAQHLRSVPGVESAAVSEWPLLDGNSYRYYDVAVPGAPPADVTARFLTVSPGWIETMKLPLIQGRDLRAAETGAAIVNREFARQYFAGENPLGKWFDTKVGSDWGRRFQIVGLAADTRYRKVRDPILPIAYIPFRDAWHKETLIVRVAPGSPASLASTLRQEVSRAMPGFRVIKIRTHEGMLQAQTVRERLLATLALFFAIVALLLAGIGLYGVLDYSVFQRRREIGIRIAIGAQAGDIGRRVTAGVFAMLLTGALAGLAIGLASARYIETLFYQVKATDPGMLAIPSLAILTAAFLAALPAVIRAVRIDPAQMLRSE